MIPNDWGIAGNKTASFAVEFGAQVMESFPPFMKNKCASYFSNPEVSGSFDKP
jgi:hypothetical protein